MARRTGKIRIGVLDAIVLAGAIAAVAYIAYRVDSVLVYN